MYSFADLIRRTPPPTVGDTAITDRHSDTTISSSEHTGCGYPGLFNRKNRSDMCRRRESNLRLLRERRTPYPLGQALRSCHMNREGNQGESWTLVLNAPQRLLPQLFNIDRKKLASPLTNLHKMLKIQQIFPKLYRCLLYVVFHDLKPQNAELIDVKKDLN